MKTKNHSIMIASIILFTQMLLLEIVIRKRTIPHREKSLIKMMLLAPLRDSRKFMSQIKKLESLSKKF
jgi:hypothetical protein